MTSYDATAFYSEPLENGKDRLFLDLCPAIPASFGASHRAMVEHFGMQETGEIAGMMSLRATSNLDKYLAFFGPTWQEALERWPTLAAFDKYRRTTNPRAYISLDEWERFYEYLAGGIRPIRMDVAFIEHY